MEIKISAAALMRSDGATLLVRKRGTSAFMQPGGKIDIGETAIQALCRELHEELGIVIKPEAPRYLGSFSAPAANEADATVTAEMFQIETDATIHPQAEIEDARWVLINDANTLELAPLTRDIVLPLIWNK
ncbi:NUDIX hydrolase [Brucellaceae bacterium C25G]